MPSLSQFFAELLTLVSLLNGAGSIDSTDASQGGTPFSVAGTVSGLQSTEPLILGLGDARLEVDEDGPFIFGNFPSADASYES